MLVYMFNKKHLLILKLFLIVEYIMIEILWNPRKLKL